MNKPAILAFADGNVFYGTSIGVDGQTVGEVVFNTAITGYQEILTDPSYASQIVTLTYPHIGNVGVTAEDSESQQVWAAGLIIRDLPITTSSWRAQMSLPDYLQKNKVVAIAEIDTRQITHLLREKGALNACIMAGKVDEKAAIAAARNFAGLNGADLAKVVSTKKSYTWSEGTWNGTAGFKQPAQLNYHVVVYDFGVKKYILRRLVDSGCRLTVVPAETSAQEVLALKPDGVFFSNGPGDPAACTYAIAAIQELLKHQLPLFGICLGHQLLGLACGAKTVKMKFGHHGANHPVQELATKRVLITSQNHGFTVDEKSLPSFLKPTHRSLFDGSLQGIRHTEKPVFAFQGHPEASPGPHDISDLFQHFVELMRAA